MRTLTIQSLAGRLATTHGDNKKPLIECFLIEGELDTQNPIPQKMAKSITKDWKNENLRKIFEPLIINMLVLAKKFPIDEKSINDKVSDSIYEMF